MREAHPTQARNWRASEGLSRHFPVRHDPVVSANTLARGGSLSPPRVRLRSTTRKHIFTYIAALTILAVLTGAAASLAASSSDAWTGLDSGRLGDYVWEVKAKRQGGAGGGEEGAQRPCLLVGTTWELGPYNFRRSRYRACTGASSQLTAANPPLLATGVQPSSGNSVKMTAVGMIFAPAVREVRITLTGGQEKTVRLHRLSIAQSRSARLERFEYAAFAIRGLWCAERLVSLTATGRTLWDSGTDEFGCSASGTGNSGAPEFSSE
jgi:hypothetical protein